MTMQKGEQSQPANSGKTKPALEVAISPHSLSPISSPLLSPTNSVAANNRKGTKSAIRYGDVVKLYTRSAFVESNGGFLGFLPHEKSASQRNLKASTTQQVLVVSPVNEKVQAQFVDAEFIICPIRSDKTTRYGSPLVYNKLFLLKTSDGMGYSLNNKTPGFDQYISLQPMYSKGEMHISIQKEGYSTETNVHSGDLVLTLNVHDSNRIRTKYNKPLGHFMVPKSNALGGYVCCGSSTHGSLLKLKVVKCEGKTVTTKCVKDPIERPASDFFDMDENGETDETAGGNEDFSIRGKPKTEEKSAQTDPTDLNNVIDSSGMVDKTPAAFVQNIGDNSVKVTEVANATLAADKQADEELPSSTDQSNLPRRSIIAETVAPIMTETTDLSLNTIELQQETSELAAQVAEDVEPEYASTSIEISSGTDTVAATELDVKSTNSGDTECVDQHEPLTEKCNSINLEVARVELCEDTKADEYKDEELATDEVCESVITGVESSEDIVAELCELPTVSNLNKQVTLPVVGIKLSAEEPIKLEELADLVESSRAEAMEPLIAAEIPPAPSDSIRPDKISIQSNDSPETLSNSTIPSFVVALTSNGASRNQEKANDELITHTVKEDDAENGLSEPPHMPTGSVTYISTTLVKASESSTTGNSSVLHSDMNEKKSSIVTRILPVPVSNAQPKLPTVSLADEKKAIVNSGQVDEDVAIVSGFLINARDQSHQSGQKHGFIIDQADEVTCFGDSDTRTSGGEDKCASM